MREASPLVFPKIRSRDQKYFKRGILTKKALDVSVRYQLVVKCCTNLQMTTEVEFKRVKQLSLFPVRNSVTYGSFISVYFFLQFLNRNECLMAHLVG